MEADEGVGTTSGHTSGRYWSGSRKYGRLRGNSYWTKYAPAAAERHESFSLRGRRHAPQEPLQENRLAGDQDHHRGGGFVVRVDEAGLRAADDGRSLCETGGDLFCAGVS